MNTTFEDEISIKEIISCIYKRRKIVLITFLITTIISSLYAFLPYFNRDKKYEAISSISIVYKYKAPENPEEIGEGYVYYQDRLQNIMIPTIKGYSESYSILRSVIMELDLKNKSGKYIREKDLSNNVTIVNQAESNLIRIIVKYNNEEKAAEIANRIPQKLIQMSEANPDLSNYDISILDYAVANEIEKKSSLIIVFIGMGFGVILGIFLAFFMNFISNKIFLSSQVKRLGLHIEFKTNDINSLKSHKQIISVAKLIGASTILIGFGETSESSEFEELINNAKKQNIEIKLISYLDEDFLIRAKDADTSFILVEEKITNINELEEKAISLKKYNINTSVIYIEK